MKRYTQWTICEKCKYSGPMKTIYCGLGQGIPNCDDASECPEHMHRQCPSCNYLRTDLLPDSPETDDEQMQRELEGKIVMIRPTGDSAWEVKRANLESR